MRRSALVGALGAVTLASAAPPTDAQPERRGQRAPRRVLLALIGTGAGAAVGTSYSLTRGKAQSGTCGSSRCVLLVTTAAGAMLGYMIGREVDELHAVRYRGGAPLSPRVVSVPLPGEPGVLAARGDLVAVGGTAGVQLFRSGAGLQTEARRAAGVRGILALDLGDVGALALGSLSGLYLYPPRAGPGTLLREGEIGATAAAADRVYFAVGSRIEVAPLSADTARSWPGVHATAPVGDLAYDAARDILWAVTDSALVGFRPAGDSLQPLARMPVAPGARRVAADGALLAVAFGDAGVRLIDVSDAAAPRERWSWTGARFSYDVSLGGDRLFVAAGPEGVYVLDAGGSAPRVIGIARELGFAAALASRGAFTFIIDRRANMLRRIRSDLQ
jgi:hypothetical protein